MRIAVVTGATSGMGREMAVQLNDNIPNIDEFWLLGRRREALEALDKLLTKPCRLLDFDLADEQAFSRYEALLEERKPQILFLVNAAGFGQIGTVGELTAQQQQGMIDVNVRALTMMTRLSLPYMAKKSRIIQFASAAAFLPQPAFAVYAASKSYVKSFSLALNEELRGSGCFVTAVCPGPVRTAFFARAETTGVVPLYKHIFMADCKKVVRKALWDSVLKQPLSIYGASMKGFAILCRLVPERWIFGVMRMLNAAFGKA